MKEMTMIRGITRRTLLQSTSMLAAAALFPRSVWAASEPSPKSGGILMVAADSEPRNLNPAMVASNGVFYVASKVIEPLAEMAYGKEGVTPVLATSWTPSADGLSVAFSLRPEVKWHDGNPFTSADVAFSALEVWKKHQNLGRIIFKDLEAVDTPDPLTAIFRFSKPTPFQLIRNALPAVTAVLPKHLYAGTDVVTNPANLQLIGTGPYRFIETRPGEYTRLERNPDYWQDGRPYLEGIVYRVLPDRGAIAAALETDDIQLAAFSAVPLSDLARLAKVEGLKVVPQGYEGITYQLTVEINHRRPELANSLVRQALAHAIDQRLVVETIFFGYATVANSPVPKSAKDFHAEDVPLYPFDPKKAEALLDQAGYRRKADGVRFSLRLRPAPWFEQTKQFGDYLRQALKTVGIDIQIVTADSAAHTKAVYTDHDFDLAVGSPVYRNDPAISTTLLYRSGQPAGVPFSNQYGYTDADVDSLIDRAATTLDSAERSRLYRQFQRVVGQSLPLIPVVEFTFITVVRDSVHNVATNPRWATSSWADVWLES